MAKLSSDKTYVTVERGDTLTQIAVDYAGGYSKYKQLAAINNISNPNLIYVGQKIYLSKTGSSGSSSSANNSPKPFITSFGLQSNADNVLFATWTWQKSNTESYKVLWTYSTGDGVWFVGSNSTNTVDSDAAAMSRQSTYSIPSNARKVSFKVKPISKKYRKNDKDVSYWSAEWSDTKTWTDKTPLETPPTPSVEIDNYKLTATLDGLDLDATHIQFQVVKNNAASAFKTSGNVAIVSSHASYACAVDAGGEYKVRCRATKNKGIEVSEWSAYSSNYATIPATPSGITSIKANSETSVYLEWGAVPTATTYDLEYTTKKQYFDGSDQTTTQSGIEFTHFEKTGLESGEEYFFRVRATNEKGSSGWSEVKSVIVGKKPAAPTTWSSTTTATTGEELTLYWVHNTEDGSSQTFAELELTIDGVTQVPNITIENNRSEEDKDKTSFYKLDTSEYIEGTGIQWKVRTAGITNTYGDWSIERTIDIYAPPTLELSLTDKDANSIETLTKFPCYVKALAGPKTQAPIGYQLVIVANDLYDTVDNVGNSLTVNEGDQVYSKYFDTMEQLLVELSASNIDLQNGVNYTINCSVTMNSGLTADATLPFAVSWQDTEYEPNAEIGVDPDTLTASIRPYCEDSALVTYQVTQSNGSYSIASQVLDSVYGEPVAGATVSTGEQVYFGVTADDVEVYYCLVEEKTPITNVFLSVYRREFDGSFTELAKDLDGEKSTTVTDPHPSLDYARYRIVAVDKDTGSVNFYDPPGYPVGGTAVVIQWDEEWSNFETTTEDALVKPPWAGSMLKLPYNIDVSDKNTPDVSLVEYTGRAHPVSYYGTQLGHSATWNVVIEATDKETIYALRRLSRWMGDVYVREPSGTGYWANLGVSFNQKHGSVTIPVTIELARVEGGV